MGISGRIVFPVVLLFFTVCARAQYFSNYDLNKDLFIRNVKLIDEFIERFNDDKTTYLRKALAAEDSQYNISRGMLLVSLFDLENRSYTDKDTVLKGFFHCVLNKERPIYLSFNDTNWFATAQCIFLSNGRLVELPLTLRVKSNGEWAKWMIAGVGGSSLNHDKAPSVSVNDKNVKTQGYISTSAYATNFVELHYVFTKDMEPANVFENSLLVSDKGREFVSSLKNGSLRFQYVKKITFHFFQVKDWMFSVDHFKRQSYNSGWLISSIQKVTAPDKDAAIQKLLSP